MSYAFWIALAVVFIAIAPAIWRGRHAKRGQGGGDSASSGGSDYAGSGGDGFDGGGDGGSD